MTENVVENVGSFAPTTTNVKSNLGAAESQAALAAAMPAIIDATIQFGYAPQFVPKHKQRRICSARLFTNRTRPNTTSGYF